MKKTIVVLFLFLPQSCKFRESEQSEAKEYPNGFRYESKESAEKVWGFTKNGTVYGDEVKREGRKIGEIEKCTLSRGNGGGDLLGFLSFYLNFSGRTDFLGLKAYDSVFSQMDLRKFSQLLNGEPYRKSRSSFIFSGDRTESIWWRLQGNELEIKQENYYRIGRNHKIRFNLKIEFAEEITSFEKIVKAKVLSADASAYRTYEGKTWGWYEEEILSRVSCENFVFED
jgi:hypothetical protein